MVLMVLLVVLRILNESNFMEVMNVAIGNVNKRKLQRNYFVFEATADIINLTSQNFYSAVARVI